MKILVALDGSENGLRVAKYVSRVASRQDWNITLYHVLQVPAALGEHGGSENPEREVQLESDLDAETEKWQDQKRVKCAQEIFTPALELFKQETTGSCRIETEVSFDFQGDPGLDIIQKVRVEEYDTVVLGRRGHSPLREFSFGRVSFNIVHHLRGCAIWIIE
jgi:nucleotide-binding universal stress UspA family protein